MRISPSIHAYLAATALVAVTAVEAPAQSAQPPAGERRFDVASVKPGLSPYELGRRAAEAGSGRGFSLPFMGTRTEPGGRFMGNSTLKQLIAYAFDLRDYQIEGGPPWLTTDYFEIAAVAGFEATPAEMRSMVQALLAERFALRTHSDTRQAPLYVLTLARPDGRLGPGLKRTSPECVQELEQRKSGTAPPRPPQPAFNGREFPTSAQCGMTMMMGRANGGSTILMGGTELTSLVRQISGELMASVIDRTELTGLFDITLEYMSERQLNGRAAGLDANGADVPPPTLMPALQTQLGLKLDKQIGAMPIVVIDAADRPTAD